MRHALGVLGVLAAGVLLAVSAAMNYQFGFQLGKEEFDGQLYGSASVAADCMKALAPFFIFAAIKNRMWVQAAASTMVLMVVVVYSLTSALGHAALNRGDTSGKRATEVQAYQDLRADLTRAKEQLAWVPAHRPAATVQGELSALETQRRWQSTEGCTNATVAPSRAFCENHAKLGAELASANEAAKLEARVAEVQAKLAKLDGVTHSAADPQATVLAKIAGVFMPGISVDDVQMALTIFLALLLEVGSGLGMYIAFSQWRLAKAVTIRQEDNQLQPAVSEVRTLEPQPLVASNDMETAATVSIAKPGDGANDNVVMPQIEASTESGETNVEAFYRESIVWQDGNTVNAAELYQDYCNWCEQRYEEPHTKYGFFRDLKNLGVDSVSLRGERRYKNIALRSMKRIGEDKNLPAPIVKAA